MAAEQQSLLVSVITPVFNSAQFLPFTIESIINQSFRDWELILIDDCSNDSSVAIAENYVAQDDRVKLLRLRKNSGAAISRNSGIEAARGRFIAFLDSDDLWHEDKLARQLSFMHEKDCAFSYTWYRCIDEAGVDVEKLVRPPPTLSYDEMLKSNQIGCLTAMYDTHKLGKVYMPLIRKRQDYGLWLKILKQVECAYGLQECLSLYRQRSGSISSNKMEMLKYNWSLYREIERLPTAKAAYYLGWNIIRKVMK